MSAYDITARPPTDDALNKIQCNTVFAHLYINPGVKNLPLTVPLNDVLEVSVHSIEIPRSYNIIRTGVNNRFILRYTPSIAPDPEPNILVPDGNYPAEALASYITSVLAANGNAFVAATTVLYNEFTNKFIISSNNGAQSISTDDPFSADSVFPIMGFTSVPGFSPALTSDQIINLSGPDSLLIRSNELTKSSYSGMTIENAGIAPKLNNNSNIFWKVPVTVNSRFTINNSPKDSNVQYQFNTHKRLLNIDIDLLYPDTLESVNLNNLPWSMTLKIKVAQPN